MLSLYLWYLYLLLRERGRVIGRGDDNEFVGFKKADLQRVRRCEKTWWFAVDCLIGLTVNLVVVYS